MDKPGDGFASQKLSSRVEQAERNFRRRTGEELTFRLWQAVIPIVSDLACDPEEAAIWLLCGRRPALTAIRAEVLTREGGAPTIEMRINPDLVTPDDVRAAYRQLRGSIRGTADARILEFLSPVGRGAGVADAEERRRIWNENYPMDLYNTKESFRVVTSRAQSREDAKEGR